MLRLALGTGDRSLKRLLCVGAHSDDIEIGCGGTLLRLLGERRDTEVLWVVLSADERRAREARISADKFLKDSISTEVRVETFRDGFLPYEGTRLKEYFETLKGEFTPDLIFTPCRDDLHQDHRLVAELTWNTFRSHLILEYEVIKYDGDLGRPNVYVPLTREICQAKIRNLLKVFESQAGRTWFTADAFQAIMRLRGLECNAEQRYAEAFYGRKLSI